jgi:hypothetical protein
MALQQNVVIDKIEVVENGIVQVRERNDIFDDATPETIIASNYHRWSLTPGQDLTKQPANVTAIANAAWTPEVIAAYQAQVEANTAKVPNILTTGA